VLIALVEHSLRTLPPPEERPPDGQPPGGQPPGDQPPGERPPQNGREPQHTP
jgi:annexin A7/11